MLILCCVYMSQFMMGEVSANCHRGATGIVQNLDWCCFSHQLQFKIKKKKKKTNSISSRVLLPIKAACLLPLMTH